MFKLFGVLLIINALVATAWWTLGENPHKSWAFGVCLAAMFAGAFLILQDRATEITIKGVGTIKSAAEQATTDAKAIAELRDRMQAQSATVDLVAQQATGAANLAQELSQKTNAAESKLHEVDEALTSARRELEEIDKITEFTRIVVAAQNGDREAFDRLGHYASEQSDLSRLAADAYVGICSTYGGVIEPGFLNLSSPSDLESLARDKVREFYVSLPSIYHAHAVHIIWKREDIPKDDRLEFLASVLQSDPSLTATLYAGKFLAADTGLKWEPFKTQALLEQWREKRSQRESPTG